MREKFISEPIQPIAGAGDSAGMLRGEPGFPRRFVWRDQEYELAEVVETWKEDGPCRNGGGGERYLRKHWYKIQTADGLVMKIYFERQARSKKPKSRWWLYTVLNDQHP